MNTHITTACIFPDESKIWRLRKSADKFGINLQPYGMREDATYRGWVDIKITQLLKHVKELKGDISHVLYTDGRDSFFLTGLEEIESKYKNLGSPGCLMATETDPYPYAELGHLFPDPGHKFRWIGAGQFLAEREWLIWAWEMMIERYGGDGPDGLHEDNDQAWLMKAFVDGALGDFRLDTKCEVFQSAGNADCIVGRELGFGTKSMNVLVSPDSGDRIYNHVTGSWPCVIHFNGGYSSPETGKDKVMRPVWDALRMDK